MQNCGLVPISRILTCMTFVGTPVRDSGEYVGTIKITLVYFRLGSEHVLCCVVK
jgi:hypothetical protein